MSRLSRRALLASPLLAAPTVLRASPGVRWRMVTSWGKNLVGPGVSASRLAQRITTMSEGALSVEVFAAGEIVPAFSVFDAVSNATVEMAHSAALFWAGKMPVASLFSTVPFGLAPVGHAAWIDADGQALWDALYAPFGVKPLLGGNTGPSSAGWFRKPITSLAEMTGLRIRATGLGGELYNRLGANAVALPPSETYPALERGVIDAVELLAPANDSALGLHRVAPHLMFPGFNKPNGASELLIGAKHWQALSPALQAIVEAAARMEHDVGLAEAHRLNGQALRSLMEGGITVLRMPQEVLNRAGELARGLLAELAAKDALSAKIVASYRQQTSDDNRAWANLTRG